MGDGACSILMQMSDTHTLQSIVHTDRPTQEEEFACFILHGYIEFDGSQTAKNGWR